MFNHSKKNEMSSLDKNWNLFVVRLYLNSPLIEINKFEFDKFTASHNLIIYFAVKVNAQFSERWVNSFNSTDQYTSTQHEFIYESVIDDSGNIITTGMTLYGDNQNGIITTKFDGEGNKLWQKIYPEGAFFKYAGLCTDKWGNIIISGYKNESILTLKYSCSGHLEWERIYLAWQYSKAYDNLTDNDGNIYVAAVREHENVDIDANLLIKYSPEGSVEWVRSNEYFDIWQNNHVSKIITDNVRNFIYQIGFVDGLEHRVLVKKYNLTGQLIWSLPIQNVCVLPIWQINIDFIYDKKASIYLALESCNGYATVKIDTNGNQLRSRFYGLPLDESRSISCDAQSNVYVTGDVGTLKYNSSGTMVWSSNTGMYDVKCDSSGNFYLTGKNQNGIVLLKYNSSHILQWARTFNQSIHDSVRSKIVFDKQNNVIV